MALLDSIMSESYEGFRYENCWNEIICQGLSVFQVLLRWFDRRWFDRHGGFQFR